MTETELLVAHARSSANRNEIQHSTRCGCFCCLSLFAPAQITKWADDSRTAICPSCGVDAVVGDAFVALTESFLQEMHHRWFDERRRWVPC